MVFSSPIFLFLFLPIVLTLYPVFPGLRTKNLWLLITSLIFYAWGEVVFIFLMLASTLVNYFLGLWVDKCQEPRKRKFAVALAVILNIGTLAFFKYANFVVENLNAVFAKLDWQPIAFTHIPLPIGISFFTFHALSYVIDIYRRKWPAARNPGDTALYIFFFPQLIAGPILRWSGIAPQFLKREVSAHMFADGIRRFVGGLAKKMIIANAVAVPADQIFALPASELSAPVAWFGTLCYTIQIYFDFSGYSDMAVGLGKMFGFTFIENFDYPYISQSIKEFWRRWHISLSSWFRDYLYIPLGGNRCSEPRNYFNLVIVFFLCGLWHGASWTFVIWGLYHGFFLVLERTKFGEWQEKLPRFLRHGYTIFFFMLSWVLFKIGTDGGTFKQTLSFLSTMFGAGVSSAAKQPLARYVGNQILFAVIAGIIFAGPTWPKLRAWLSGLHLKAPGPLRPIAFSAGLVLEPILVVAVLLVSSAWLAGSTYNPFIYFRF